jgi:hypothetical protein
VDSQILSLGCSHYAQALSTGFPRCTDVYAIMKWLMPRHNTVILRSQPPDHTRVTLQSKQHHKKVAGHVQYECKLLAHDFDLRIYGGYQRRSQVQGRDHSDRWKQAHIWIHKHPQPPANLLSDLSLFLPDHPRLAFRSKSSPSESIMERFSL